MLYKNKIGVHRMNHTLYIFVLSGWVQRWGTKDYFYPLGTQGVGDFLSASVEPFCRDGSGLWYVTWHLVQWNTSREQQIWWPVNEKINLKASKLAVLSHLLWKGMVVSEARMGCPGRCAWFCKHKVINLQTPLGSDLLIYSNFSFNCR